MKTTATIAALLIGLAAQANQIPGLPGYYASTRLGLEDNEEFGFLSFNVSVPSDPGVYSDDLVFPGGSASMFARTENGRGSIGVSFSYDIGGFQAHAYFGGSEPFDTFSADVSQGANWGGGSTYFYAFWSKPGPDAAPLSRQSVPDDGSTLALLGASLVFGLAVARKGQ